MNDELCELVNAGLSVHHTTGVAIAIICGGVALFWLSRKGYVHYRYMVAALVLGTALSTTAIPTTAFAQSDEGCRQSQASGEAGSAGRLVNDNPVLSANFLPGGPPVFNGFSSKFQILNNDNAPAGDPFNVSTIQLLGNYSMPGAPHSFLILDPNNQVPPLAPGEIGDPGWENVWGYWTLELTCNIDDAENCVDHDPGPGKSLECVSSDGAGCWPTGYVFVHFAPAAQIGNYTIPYSVRTQSGSSLSPALISVTVPEIPEPPEQSPITALSDSVNSSSCGEWPVNDFSVDIMSYVSTIGSGTLLPGTIDLNPDTPAIDTSITIYGDDISNYITFTVDGNGIVSMTNPQGGYPGWWADPYIFTFTIRDTDGIVSNVGSISVWFVCG